MQQYIYNISSEIEEKTPLAQQASSMKTLETKQSILKSSRQQSPKQKISSVSSSVTHLPNKNKIQQKKVTLSTTLTNKTPLKPRTNSQQDIYKSVQSKKELIISQSTAQLQLKEEEQCNDFNNNQQNNQLVEQGIFKDQALEDINSKVDILLNKYKNVSYFTPTSNQQDSSSKQENNCKVEQTATKCYDNILLPTATSQKEKEIKPPKPLQENKSLDNKNNSTQNIVSQYVTRVSKGTGYHMTEKNKRKRMNSPTHYKQKENQQVSLFSQREVKSAVKLQRSISSERKMTRPLSISQNTKNLFLLPFPEFRYYLTYLEYFHQEHVQIATNNLKLKVQKVLNNKEEYFDGIYKEHFVQNFNALQFCKDIKIMPLNEIQKKIVQLPNIDRKKCNYSVHQRMFIIQLRKQQFLIQMKLQYTATKIMKALPMQGCIYISQQANQLKQEGDCRFIQLIFLLRLALIYVHIVLRCQLTCLKIMKLSFLLLLMNAMLQKYQIILTQIKNQFPINFTEIVVLLLLMVCMSKISELQATEILRFKMQDMLIIDNASYSFYFQLENGIPIVPFYDSPDDKELIYLTLYLNELFQSNDMVKKNSNYFKLQSYLEAEIPEDLLPKLF